MMVTIRLGNYSKMRETTSNKFVYLNGGYFCLPTIVRCEKLKLL